VQDIFQTQNQKSGTLSLAIANPISSFDLECADLMHNRWDAGEYSPAFFNFQKFLTREHFIRHPKFVSSDALKLTNSKEECQQIVHGETPGSRSRGGRF
jgi:hypothetical protein